MELLRKLIRWLQEQGMAFKRERRVRLYSFLFALSIVFYLSSEIYLREDSAFLHSTASLKDNEVCGYHEPGNYHLGSENFERTEHSIRSVIAAESKTREDLPKY